MIEELKSFIKCIYFASSVSIAIAFFQFIDDPFLRSEQRSCPVQLPLAVSGWGFKEEFSAAAVKIEKVEEDGEPMEPAVEGTFSNILSTYIVTLVQWY